MQLQKTIHLKCTTRYAQCEQFQNQEQFQSLIYALSIPFHSRETFFFYREQFQNQANLLI